MTHLFAQPADEPGINLCRKFIEYHGYVRDDVKLVQVDDWAHVVAKRDVTLHEGFVEYVEREGLWPIK